jgi:hypothetical protein
MAGEDDLVLWPDVHIARCGASDMNNHRRSARIWKKSLMPIPADSTAHAHFAPTTTEAIGSISCQRPQNNRGANQITWPGMQPPM